jgi:hypothetical protein
MKSNNCNSCKFFDGSSSCAVNPVHAATWARVEDADDYTKKQIEINGRKLDDCPEFEPKDEQQKTVAKKKQHSSRIPDYHQRQDKTVDSNY